MAGRPKLFVTPKHFTLTVESECYSTLTGSLLDEYRRKYPRACLADLMRSIIDKAIVEHRETERGMERERKRRRRELRRLATAIAGASDGDVEQRARKLAELIAGERPAA